MAPITPLPQLEHMTTMCGNNYTSTRSGDTIQPANFFSSDPFAITLWGNILPKDEEKHTYLIVRDFEAVGATDPSIKMRVNGSSLNGGSHCLGGFGFPNLVCEPTPGMGRHLPLGTHFVFNLSFHLYVDDVKAQTLVVPFKILFFGRKRPVGYPWNDTDPDSDDDDEEKVEFGEYEVGIFEEDGYKKHGLQGCDSWSFE